MACTLNIDAEILRSSIPYIYIVYSPKMKQLCDGYEYHQSNTTRCLLVNMAKYQESHGGTHIYYYTSFHAIFCYIAQLETSVIRYILISMPHTYNYTKSNAVCTSLQLKEHVGATPFQSDW